MERGVERVFDLSGRLGASFRLKADLKRELTVTSGASGASSASGAIEEQVIPIGGYVDDSSGV
jgi:hypothetical protein